MTTEVLFYCHNCDFEDWYELEEIGPIKSFPCPFCRDGRMILQKETMREVK
jgi:hypothetical protein